MMLFLAHSEAHLWWVLLFALIPFLWGVMRATLWEAVAQGVLLAACFSVLAYPSGTAADMAPFATTLFTLTLGLTLYAVLVNRIKRYVGVNAVFIAASWLPVEYLLTHVLGLGRCFALATTEPSCLFRAASLFGLLLVSFVVLLVNTITLVILRYLAQKLFGPAPASEHSERSYFSLLGEAVPYRPPYLLPDVRSPPLPGWIQQ